MGSAVAERNDNAFVLSLKDQQLVLSASDQVIAVGHHRRQDVVNGVAEGDLARGWQLVALTEAAHSRQPSLEPSSFRWLTGGGDWRLGGEIVEKLLEFADSAG